MLCYFVFVPISFVFYQFLIINVSVYQLMLNHSTCVQMDISLKSEHNMRCILLFLRIEFKLGIQIPVKSSIQIPVQSGIQIPEQSGIQIAVESESR